MQFFEDIVKDHAFLLRNQLRCFSSEKLWWEFGWIGYVVEWNTTTSSESLIQDIVRVIQCASKGERKQRWLTDFWIEQVVYGIAFTQIGNTGRDVCFSCAGKILVHLGDDCISWMCQKPVNSFINWLQFQEREIDKIYGFVGVINIYRC